MNYTLSEGSLIYTMENSGRLASIDALKAAFHQGCVLEQRAFAFDRDRNLIINLGPIKGVMPYHECALGIKEGLTRDIAVISRVGKPVCFMITGFTEDSKGNTVAVLSRRRVQELCMENYLSKLRPGDVIPCRITHIERFGCFADVGCGVSALLPIDSISVSRISHPSQRLKVGAEIRCVVKSADDNGRLLLSLKELLGTWEQNAERFAPGETVTGIVRSVESYGVFIELAPNLAGLADNRDDIVPDVHAAVYIKSIIPERMKIKLVIVDVFDPACEEPSPIEYFTDNVRIDVFRYSPACCSRVVETVFV